MNITATNISAVPHAWDIEIDVVEDIRSIKADWENLQKLDSNFIYQNYDWNRIAYETFEAENRPNVVVGRDRGEVKFIIPLVLVEGLPNLLRWPGANHNNTGVGLFSPDFLANPGPNAMKKAFAEVAKLSSGKITLLHLKNQPKTLLGFPNPMLQLPHQVNPNPIHLMDLTPGMEAILDMGNGKRKRKLFRRQQRIAEKMGGYELYIPQTAAEISAIMHKFFELKAERLAQLGVADVFADDRTRQFMLQLAQHPQKNGTQLLQLFVLKVDGKMRAMYGNGIDGASCQCCVNAIAFDDFTPHSPGEMITYLMIEHLIENGFTDLDLGLGHERYKVSWCKNVANMMDTIYPLSYHAKPFSGYLKSKTTLKKMIKNSDVLWSNFKKLRQFKARIN